MRRLWGWAKNVLMRIFLALYARLKSGEELGEPAPESDMEPVVFISRTDFLRALEVLRTDSPVAYEAIVEYLKRQLSDTRRQRLFQCSHPSEFIAHVSIWREVKCSIIESLAQDMEQTVKAITKPPEWYEDDVPPAGLQTEVEESWVQS